MRARTWWLGRGGLRRPRSRRAHPGGRPGQLALERVSGGQLAAVSGQNPGQDRHRIEHKHLPVVIRELPRRQACAFLSQPSSAIEFGCGAAAFAGVGGPAEVGGAIRVVGVAAAAQGHIQSLTVAEAVHQEMCGVDCAAFSCVHGSRVREIRMIG